MPARAELRRALVYAGGPAVLREVDRPALGPGDLRIRVLACGVCGTDLELLAGRAFAGRLPLPIRPGHEVAGAVTEVGAAAGGRFAVGDTVVLHSIGACGRCADCTSGHDNRCRTVTTLGLDHPGGFADEVVWPAARAVRFRGLAPTRAALLPDAVATAYHALRRAATAPGGTLAVIGVGGLGSHLLQLARLTRGDLRLVGVGRSERSLDRARRLGAATIAGLGAAARAEAKRAGLFDAVVDVSGAADAVEFGLATLKRGGRMVLASVHESGLTTTMTRTAFMTKELELVGSYGSSLAELREVTELAESGALDLSESVSRVISLDDLPAALTDLLTSRDGAVRTVVVPDPDAGS
ncbi:alcohol dehydrogenase catalytic domain-containing protein [Dactylosporangium sp. CA-092794]|uniref:alcohol dehydrogenase catalytic domain-containing protein n=1 Tax=Dactylosporangium sp. CA-092794 TaxID=3239929 RepID=UPI003D8A03CA